MNASSRLAPSALALALALATPAAVMARDPGSDDAPGLHKPRAEHDRSGPAFHGRWRHHPPVHVIPYAFSTAPAYVYAYPYVSVYSAPFSPGTLHFVEPGQVTVIQPMAWE
jgi:hypothetical protein